MTRSEVILRLCRLCTKVGHRHFQSRVSHDCFCGGNPIAGNLDEFRFDESVLNFIEMAVDAAIKDTPSPTAT